VIPPPSICSDCSSESEQSAVPTEILTDHSYSDTDSAVDESALGEFLMDTFEGFDKMGMPLLPAFNNAD